MPGGARRGVERMHDLARPAVSGGSFLFVRRHERRSDVMPKAQKVEAVERLKVEFRESQAALLTSFRGPKGAEMTELRRSLAAPQTHFKVGKNPLPRIAATETRLAD